MDLNKVRENDKLKKPVVLTEEDKKLIEEQKKLGKVMDKYVKKEMMLRRNKKLFHEDESLFLYRLPLNEKQMEEIHKNLQTNI